MLIIPAILDTYSSLKDRTLKLVFETNEPTPEQLTSIALSIQKAGFLAFNKDAFNNKQKDALKDMKADYEEAGKTPSQRLRGVLYRNWEQKNKGYEVFEDYYKAEMERIITHFKDKLV